MLYDVQKMMAQMEAVEKGSGEGGDLSLHILRIDLSLDDKAFSIAVHFRSLPGNTEYFLQDALQIHRFDLSSILAAVHLQALATFRG